VHVADPWVGVGHALPQLLEQPASGVFGWSCMQLPPPQPWYPVAQSEQFGPVLPFGQPASAPLPASPFAVEVPASSVDSSGSVPAVAHAADSATSSESTSRARITSVYRRDPRVDNRASTSLGEPENAQRVGRSLERQDVAEAAAHHGVHAVEEEAGVAHLRAYDELTAVGDEGAAQGEAVPARRVRLAHDELQVARREGQYAPAGAALLLPAEAVCGAALAGSTPRSTIIDGAFHRAAVSADWAGGVATGCGCGCGCGGASGAVGLLDGAVAGGVAVAARAMSTRAAARALRLALSDENRLKPTTAITTTPA
jgi:hypothetical protein